MDKTFFIILVIAILLIVIYLMFRKNFKKPTINCVNLVTGAPKTGKSLLCVNLSIKDYRKRHRIWWFKTHILKQNIEEPLFYTNTAISFGNLKSKKPHRLDKNIKMLELAHLMREKRFNYGSVAYIQESSLMADNQDFKNDVRNAQLSMFNKLFGHETKGGVLYYDTQNALDNHYSIKRVTSSYLFIQKKLNLFFFMVLYVRELVNNDVGENNFTDDVDTTTRKVLVWRNYFKKYDRYYYSYLTDSLDSDSSVLTLYKGGLVSFNPLYRDLSVAKVKDKKEGKNG